MNMVDAVAAVVLLLPLLLLLALLSINLDKRLATFSRVVIICLSVFCSLLQIVHQTDASMCACVCVHICMCV